MTLTAIFPLISVPISVSQSTKRRIHYPQHGSADKNFYLVQGTRKLYGFHKNGRQSLINFFTPFSLFGVPELFEENKRPYPWWHRQSAALSKFDTRGCRAGLLQDARFLRFCRSMALKQNVTQNRKYMSLTRLSQPQQFCRLSASSPERRTAVREIHRDCGVLNDFLSSPDAFNLHHV